MTLIRTDVQATVRNTPIEDVDIQEIEVWMGNEKFKVYNFYCPPGSKTEIALQDVIFKKTIVAGDFNAHLPFLGYSSYNMRGHNIEDLTNSTNLCLMQNSESKPTFFHRRHLTTSKPDLTLLSSDIADSATVTVLDGIGSDHQPILTNISRKFQGKPKNKRTSHWNFKKAKWNLYKEETDKDF